MPNFVRARCRLIPDFWKAAVVCLAMLALTAGVALTQPPQTFEGWSAGAAMLALWGATPFYWLVARRRGSIQLDENGARWRTAFGTWKSARWHEIESLDARLNSDGGKIKHWKFVVWTRNGAFSWTNSFENAEQLAPFAARFCSLIPAKPDDWPRRFGYRGAENLVLPFACLLLIFVFVLAIAKSLITIQWREVGAQIEIYVALYGWLLTVGGFLLFGFFVVAVPAIFLLFYWLMARQSWRHRNESFLATTDGLSWKVDERERLFAAWDEMQLLRVEARGPLVALPFYRLQSARGEFHWNNGLSGASQLGRACFERAPHLQREVQARLREELNAAPDAAPDAAGEVLVFDFKTRSLRAILYGGAFFSVFVWGAVVFGPFEPPKNGEPIPTWASFIFAVLLTAFTFYGVQLFRRGCIVLDARGIAWRLPLRQQFVAWNEVDALIVDRKFYLRIGARRVFLWPEGIPPTRLNLLLETIAQRATNAGGAWKAAHETASSRRAN